MKISTFSAAENNKPRVLRNPEVKVCESENDSSSNAKDVAVSAVKGITAGKFAEMSWSGFQASNTATNESVYKGLIENGLSPDAANTATPKIMEYIKNEPTKALFIAVAAGSAWWAIIETTGRWGKLPWSNWSVIQKLTSSIFIAGLAVIVYFILKSKGIVA